MPKSYEAEEYLPKGYVYLTTDPNEAIMYGLNKSLQDMTYLDLDDGVKKMSLNRSYRML
jgi:hypothetical protein